MRTNLLGRLAGTTTLLFILGTQALQAQQQAPNSEHAFLVQGLTASDRDELVRDLAAEPELSLAYACVPAGIVLIHAPQRADTQQRLLTLIAAGGRGLTATPTTLSRSALEDLCAAQRGQ